MVASLAHSAATNTLRQVALAFPPPFFFFFSPFANVLLMLVSVRQLHSALVELEEDLSAASDLVTAAFLMLMMRSTRSFRPHTLVAKVRIH